MDSTRPLLLGAYAARSCAVKTHNAYDPTVESPALAEDEVLQQRFERGIAYEDEVVRTLLAAAPEHTIDLRPLAEQGWSVREDACLAAMGAGTPVIIGGALPSDARGHRVGLPDLWVRGADTSDGRPGYHPVEVKWHLVQEVRRSKKVASELLVASLVDPAPQAGTLVSGLGFRAHRREGDLLQLAHYWRLLEAAGFAAGGTPWAAVIGTDLDAAGAPMLTWLDLSTRVIKTFSRSQESGTALRSVLERYDHEHAFRVQVAEVAARQAEPDPPTPLVQPIVVEECKTCPWWEHCRTRLPADDVSLVISKSTLDVREIRTLRSLGVTTITDLVGVDLDALLPDYLPEVTHRGSAEQRLRLAARRARMINKGVSLERTTEGEIDLPAAELEIDFDIETSMDRRVYLWGFLVTDTRTGEREQFHAFTRWRELDDANELILAQEALGWLLERLSGAASAAVYHYSEYEVSKITELARRTDDPVITQTLAMAEDAFVDLFPVVREHLFAVNGLGLKEVASRGAGFAWRDVDPGGLNSQGWFAEAIGDGPPDLRRAARQRLLDYNEDDVRATAALRDWLRRGAPPPE